MKKLAALLICALLFACVSLAEIWWPENPTEGQRQLQRFVETANLAMESTGTGVINMRYEMYSTFASLGMDGIEMPEDPLADFIMPVEMYFTMTRDGLVSLQLRMHDADRFAEVAAACLHASSPSVVTVEGARVITDAYVSSIKANPTAGFEEDISPLQGEQPRAYFAYYPNQFFDHRNWVQMTLVFARPGSADANVVVPISTPAPEEDVDQVWLSNDNYTHLEVFASPTPEPDSAAME